MRGEEDGLVLDCLHAGYRRLLSLSRLLHDAAAGSNNEDDVIPAFCGTPYSSAPTAGDTETGKGEADDNDG